MPPSPPRELPRIRHRRHDGDAFLYAFDLIGLNGDDQRRDPLDVRKATLRSMLAKAGLGLRFNGDHAGCGAARFSRGRDSAGPSDSERASRRCLLEELRRASRS
jgi:hypothetical protein